MHKKSKCDIIASGDTMKEVNLVAVKSFGKVEDYSTDTLIDSNFTDIKIIFSLSNDILIRMGRKNEWLSQDEIYITNYKKTLQIDSPFLSEYKVIYLKVSSIYAERFLNKRYLIKGNQKLILNSVFYEYERLQINPDSKITMGIIKSLCEQFFLLILRNNLKVEKYKKSPKSDLQIINSLITYFNEHLGEEIRFSDIVKKAGLSSTGLKNLFKEYTGMGVMQYYNYLKIEKAKQYLLMDDLNATQIANLLGYESIHYFSRQFKNMTGLSPTQYRNSLT